MANPQLEDGFTRISNEIMSKLAVTKLNGTQFRILMVVFRFTYGYSRKSHSLSESFISDKTGINKRQIKRELASLIERNILCVTKEATFTSSREITFNKNYDEWIDTSEQKSTQVTKKTPPSEKVTSPGGKIDTSGGVGLDTHIKKGLKKDLKKDTYVDSINEIWDYYSEKIKALGKTRKKTSSKTSHIRARLSDGFSVDDIKNVMDAVFNDPFMLGKNDRNKEYLDIDNFLKNTEKVEKWLDRKVVQPKQEAQQGSYIPRDENMSDINKLAREMLIAGGGYE